MELISSLNEPCMMLLLYAECKAGVGVRLGDPPSMQSSEGRQEQQWKKDRGFRGELEAGMPPLRGDAAAWASPLATGSDLLLSNNHVQLGRRQNQTDVPWTLVSAIPHG